MELPKDFLVDTGRLAGCFKHTSATYKFYWLLGLLAEVEQGKERVEKKALFAHMVAGAWYTVNYFKVSFGASDQLQQAIGQIKQLEGLAVDASPEAIHRRLMQSKKAETQRVLQHFDINVPHKFLSPWLGSGSKQGVYALSQNGFENPPYALYKDHVLLQPTWVDYFRRYAGILRGFCLWHLTLFLQARNPNVPDVPNKLLRPERRGSLSAHKKRFWDLVLDRQGGMDCIYTGKRLHVGDYDVEHFIPYQFVAHDQMWNLIPADPSFNSSKGDKLPPLDLYFDAFFRVQREAVSIVQSVQPKSKFLEDYLQLFPSHDFDAQAYRSAIEPLVSIASNNGFQFMRPPGAPGAPGFGGSARGAAHGGAAQTAVS